MVAQPIESSTVTPAVNALRRFFLAHGHLLPVEHAERIHAIVVGSLLAAMQRDCPSWRFDREFGLAPGSVKDRAYRNLACAWYMRGAHIRSEARLLGKNGRARLQAWLDAGCPWTQF